jgi:hypothetical protein
MRSFRSKPVGWQNESHRHYLAAKGVKTKHNYMAMSRDAELKARLKLMRTVRHGLQDVDRDLTQTDIDALKAERALAGAGVGLATAAVVGSGAVTPKAHVEFTGNSGAEVAYVPFEDLGPGWASKEDALVDALRVTKPGEVAKIESGRLMPVWEHASEWQPGDTITTGIGRFDEEATSRSLGSGVSVGGSHPGSMASMTPKGEFVPQIPVHGVAEFGKAKLVGAAQGAGVIGGVAAIGEARSGLKFREDEEREEAQEWMKAREGAAGAKSEAAFEKEFGSRRTVKGPEDRAWVQKIEADD